MATRIPTASVNAGANAIVDRFDAGAAAGYVQIRTGAQPATGNDAATGTLLATITLSDPAFAAAVAGVKVADITPALSIPATTGGVAGWYRGYDSDDNPVIDGAVTGTGGGGELQLNTTTLVATVPVEITSWNITMPAG